MSRRPTPIPYPVRKDGARAALPSIPHRRPLQGALKSDERGGHSLDDDRLMRRLARHSHAPPKLSCGVGEQREPIYVVDEQGNIIRTLHR